MKFIKTEIVETQIEYEFDFTEDYLEYFNHEIKGYMVDGDMVRDFTMEDIERLFDPDRAEEPRCLDEVHTFQYGNYTEQMTIGEKMYEVLEQMTFDNCSNSNKDYGDVVDSYFELAKED